MDLIEQIEDLRKKMDWTPTEMGRQFGVIYQNYNNWVARGSLPKKYYPVAEQLLAKHEQGLTEEDRLAMDRYKNLSPAGRAAVQNTVDLIFALENKALPPEH